MSEHADQFEEREEDEMSQYEQENDLGGGGGEADDDTLGEAWDRSGEGGDEPGEGDAGGSGNTEPDADEPWAKTSSGDVDDV